MTEFGTILLSLGIVAMFYLGRLKHRPHPPRWVLNPIMNLLVWIPFVMIVVGFVIAVDSIVDADSAGTTIYDELVSILILAGAVVLAAIMRRKPRNVPA